MRLYFKVVGVMLWVVSLYAPEPFVYRYGMSVLHEHDWWIAGPCIVVMFLNFSLFITALVSGWLFGGPDK